MIAGRFLIGCFRHPDIPTSPALLAFLEVSANTLSRPLRPRVKEGYLWQKWVACACASSWPSLTHCALSVSCQSKPTPLLSRMVPR